MAVLTGVALVVVVAVALALVLVVIAGVTVVDVAVVVFGVVHQGSAFCITRSSMHVAVFGMHDAENDYIWPVVRSKD